MLHFYAKSAYVSFMSQHLSDIIMKNTYILKFFLIDETVWVSLKISSKNIALEREVLS